MAFAAESTRIRKTFPASGLAPEAHGGGDRAGARTQDLLIKSQLLYRLSYAIAPIGDDTGAGLLASHDRQEQIKPLRRFP
jgi:hypothetical protein